MEKKTCRRLVFNVKIKKNKKRMLKYLRTIKIQGFLSWQKLPHFFLELKKINSSTKLYLELSALYL